jgi:hypothetical protein
MMRGVRLSFLSFAEASRGNNFTDLVSECEFAFMVGLLR